MQEMPRAQRQTLWGKLASLLQDVLQELPPERWDRGREEGMEEESALDPVSLSVIIFTVVACSVGTLLLLNSFFEKNCITVTFI